MVNQKRDEPKYYGSSPVREIIFLKFSYNFEIVSNTFVQHFAFVSFTSCNKYNFIIQSKISINAPKYAK